MAMRVKWDQYETAILVDYCALAQAGELSRAEAVRLTSKELRDRAVKLGMEIDDVFRNTNGISMQMVKIEDILSGRQNRLSPPPPVFSETVELFKNDKHAFKALLGKARLALTNETVKKRFSRWLANHAPEEDILELCLLYPKIEQFALNQMILRKPLFETTDLDTITAVHDLVNTDSAFRYVYRDNIEQIAEAMTYYHEFAKLDTAETAQVPDYYEKQNAPSEQSDRLSPQLTETCEQQPPTIENKEDAEVTADIESLKYENVLDDCKWPNRYKIANGLGEIVYVLTDPYFRPTSFSAFKALAEKEGLTSSELAMHLFGTQCLQHDTIFTDDYVYNFLIECCSSRGMDIPEDASGNWYRNYLDRQQLSHEELLELFELYDSEESDYIDVEDTVDFESVITPPASQNEESTNDENTAAYLVDYEEIDVLQERNLCWPEPYKLENELGEVVFILKEPHFRPYETVDFNEIAEERYGVSPYELSLSLFGIPLTGKTTKYTDDYIKEYLEKRIERGEVAVPKSTEAPWYRGFLRRKHMSHDGLLALYGLNPTKEAECETLFDEDGIANEDALPAPEEPPANRFSELENLLDPTLAKKLVDEYGLVVKKLSKWLDTSIETLRYCIQEGIGTANWQTKELSGKDLDDLMFLVERNSFLREKGDLRHCILNNRKDNAYALCSAGPEIRVIELDDMPADLANAILSKGMERLVRKEVAALENNLGEYVEIVGVKHFRPVKTKDFRELAAVRSMELEDYAQFLCGMPLCASKATKTDDDIRAFLEEHTVDGITTIPSGNKGQWLRNIARKHNMTEEELIRFYGLTSSALSRSFNALSEEPDTVEAEPSANIAASLEESVQRAFQENALIGNALFTKEQREELNGKAKVLISKGMAGYDLTLEEKMAVTLAASYCVKDWDEKKSNFWNFISIQFGYRSESESGASTKLRNLLCDCVETSLTSNNRWFVSTETGRQFKATLLIHGMGPRGNWLHLCDFLYDFYKDNLCGIVADNDPLIRKMVMALGSRMNYASELEDRIRISSKAYLFQEAIKKLVCSRPRYASKMFERMIKRIDSIIAHTNTKAIKYEERLIDLWWEQRLQPEGSLEKIRGKEGVALSHSVFKPSFSWDIDSNNLHLVFPALRLEETSFDSLELAYLVDEKIIERKKLRYHGNDFGKTMASFTEDIGNSIRRGFVEGLSVHVQILCDDNPIYDSAKSLFRKALVFQGTHEIKPELCKQGDYIIVGPKDSMLEVGNAESDVIRDDQSMKAFFVELGEGFFVALNERLLCSDNETENSSNPAVFIRNEWPNAKFIDDDSERTLVGQNSAISIALPCNAEPSNLQLTIAHFVIPWTSMKCEEHANHRYYEFQLNLLETGRVDVLIRDLSRAKVVGIKRLYLVSDLSYDFDKPYYFSSNDYEEACVTYAINGESGKASFASTAHAAQVLMDGGSLEFAIPAITLKDCVDMTWGANFIEWAGNIQEDRTLTTRHPDTCTVFLKAGNRNVAEENSGTFFIGNTIRAIAETSAERWIDVSLCAAGNTGYVRQYPIGRIALEETFLEQPQFAVKDSILKWNCGGRYIGAEDARLTMRFDDSEGRALSYSLDTDSNIISDSVSISDGVYHFEIHKESDDPFELQSKIIAKGSFFAGNKDAYRFVDSIIAIDATTFTRKDELSNEDVELQRIELEPVYIDNIEFIEMRQFEGSERAEYSGMLYYTSNGKKHYYSSKAFVDKQGNERAKINPVRIIYLSDMAICMTDEDGDAPYCTRRKTTDPYRIDSIANPGDKRPDYTILPDLFSYRKEAL